MQLSVIVPVYNVAQYLPDCIESILAQNFRDFELILVDDGSTDDSGRICDEYADKDERIQVIHQKNGGVTKARKTGVENAKGEWICFVDADDTIPTNSLESLVLSINKGTDIVIGSMDGRNLPKSITLRDYRAACIGGTIFSTALWAKLYRRSLFNDWVFNIPRDIKVGEDLLMNVRLAFKTDYSPMIIPYPIVYYYRSTPQSIMHTYTYTVDYASQRLKYLLQSIPKEFFESFRYDYNMNVWRLLSRIVYDNPKDHSWKRSSLYLYLKEEIKKKQFKMTLSQRMALWPKNKWQLRIVNKLIGVLS